MIINANNIIPEFSQANMNALVQTYPLGGLRYRNFFPLTFNPTLSFGTLESAGSAKVMADIVAIGSKAPRKSREFIASIKGEIPKIEIARDMNEKDLLVLQQLRQSAVLYPNSAGIKNQLIDRVYADIPFVIDGVNARMEWMAKQLVSAGSFTTSVANNSGGVSNVKVDFGVASKNAAKDWHNAADADPIAEIIAEQELARGKGYAYVQVVMDRVTLNKVLVNALVKQFVFGLPANSSSTFPNITIDQLNAQLASQGLPIIVLWESFVAAETKAGVKTNDGGWVAGNVLFAVDAQLGEAQYTTTTEFAMNFPDTMSQSISDEFILVKTFGHQDPISISTKGTAFAIPVLNNVKRNVILKTKLA